MIYDFLLIVMCMQCFEYFSTDPVGKNNYANLICIVFYQKCLQCNAVPCVVVCYYKLITSTPFPIVLCCTYLVLNDHSFICGSFLRIAVLESALSTGMDDSPSSGSSSSEDEIFYGKQTYLTHYFSVAVCIQSVVCWNLAELKFFLFLTQCSP